MLGTIHEQLLAQAAQLKTTRLIDLFKNDLQRAQTMHLQLDGLYFDFSKNLLNESVLDLLICQAEHCGIGAAIDAMFNGKKINNTENRAVLHTALRSPQPELWLDGHNIMDDIHAVQHQMQEFCYKIHSQDHLGYSGKAIDTIVNIGIGGSDLGPVLLCQALKPYRVPDMRIEFISSVDGYMFNDVVATLNPETTLFIIASKTFTTQETMTNAQSARQWFLQRTRNNQAAIAKHFIALSTNQPAVTEFGIAPENMFAFWDFVGGRYSSWSAIGLSVALYIGYANFRQLLAGAHAMDQHFRECHNWRHNLPVILALIGYWHVNYCDYRSLIISPYNTRLARFPAYIQQLEMESNGKGVNKDGNSLNYLTCPVVWGDSGINGQHAYYQLLHQGQQIIPMDIIIAISDQFSAAQHNDILWSNAIAQAEALMCGKDYATAQAELLQQGLSKSEAEQLAKHKVFPGNRPSNMLVVPEISPYYLGMLLALYEHKTFVQGLLWQVNSFDQMGVELGKQLAKRVLAELEAGQAGSHDNSTVALIQHYLANRSKILP